MPGFGHQGPMALLEEPELVRDVASAEAQPGRRRAQEDAGDAEHEIVPARRGPVDHLAGGLAVGLVFLFLRNADLHQVWASVRAAHAGYLLLALGSVVVTYLVRAERWQYLLSPLGPTRFSNVLRTTVIGFGASAVLPARAGEVIRPYLLARKEGLSAPAAMATILVERILDLVAVLKTRE